MIIARQRIVVDSLRGEASKYGSNGMDCLIATSEEDGFSGLYRGFASTVGCLFIRQCVYRTLCHKLYQPYRQSLEHAILRAVFHTIAGLIGMLYVVCCLLFVVCCLLFVVCCLLFVVCCCVLCVVVVVIVVVVCYCCCCCLLLL